MKAIAVIGAFLGLTSVLMGAASDHLFPDPVAMDYADRLDVALRYHQLYAILILGLGWGGIDRSYSPTLKWASYLFCVGTVIFCTSLYVSLALQFDKAVYFTPVGGSILIVAWVILLIGLVRLRRPSSC